LTSSRTRRKTYLQNSRQAKFLVAAAANVQPRKTPAGKKSQFKKKKFPEKKDRKKIPAAERSKG
jgi:hypothetical protein